MLFQNDTLCTTGPGILLPGGAFESKTGVQVPVGIFNPLGFFKDGVAIAFYRRRCTVRQQGRMYLIAAMIYVTPEYYRRECYCSPSAFLSFAYIQDARFVRGGRKRLCRLVRCDRPCLPVRGVPAGLGLACLSRVFPKLFGYPIARHLVS